MRWKGEGGDAGIMLLFLLVAVFVAPVAILSDAIRDTTGELVLYVTAVGLAFSVWRSIRKYVFRPLDLILKRTAHVPAIRRHMHRQERMWRETYAQFGTPLPDWYVDELEQEAEAAALIE